MAGQLTISTLSDGANSTSSTNCIQGSAKAWVRFAGATGTIAGSYNVSSVTVNSTGYWTIAFTNALANANYSVVGSLSATSGTGQSNIFEPFTNVSTGGTTAPTTSSFICSSIAGGATTPVYACVSVFS